MLSSIATLGIGDAATVAIIEEYVGAVLQGNDPDVDILQSWPDTMDLDDESTQAFKEGLRTCARHGLDATQSAVKGLKDVSEIRAKREVMKRLKQLVALQDDDPFWTAAAPE